MPQETNAGASDKSSREAALNRVDREDNAGRIKNEELTLLRNLVNALEDNSRIHSDSIKLQRTPTNARDQREVLKALASLKGSGVSDKTLKDLTNYVRNAGVGGGASSRNPFQALVGSMPYKLGGHLGSLAGGITELFAGTFALGKILDVADSVLKLVDEQILLSRNLRKTFAMPGVSTNQIGVTDMWALAKSIDAGMKKFSNGILTLEDFENVMKALKETGLATMAPLFAGGPTMAGAVKTMNENMATINASRDEAQLTAVSSITDTLVTQTYNRLNPGKPLTLSQAGLAANLIPMDTLKAIQITAIDKAAAQGKLTSTEDLTMEYDKSAQSLVKFALEVGKTAVATGITTDAMIKNASQTYRMEEGFEGYGRMVTDATLGVEDMAIMSAEATDNLGKIRRPADEFVNDMTSATDVMRFFSTDIDKSRKSLIGLNIAEGDAIRDLVFSLTDVANTMNNVFKPDLNQSALALEMLTRHPNDYKMLSQAFSKMSTPGRLAAMELLPNFNAQELQGYLSGANKGMVPSLYTNLASLMGTDLKGLLNYVPDVQRLLGNLPEMILNMTGAKGGNRAFMATNLLPQLFPWVQLSDSRGRQLTQATMTMIDNLTLASTGLKDYTNELTNLQNEIAKLKMSSTYQQRVGEAYADVMKAIGNQLSGIKTINATTIELNGPFKLEMGDKLNPAGTFK